MILHFFLKTKWFPFEHTLTQFSASLLNCTSVCILEHFKVYIVCISILWPCAISSSKWALVIMTWCWIFMYVVSSSMSYSFILINNSTLVWLEGPLKASLSLQFHTYSHWKWKSDMHTILNFYIHKTYRKDKRRTKKILCLLYFLCCHVCHSCMGIIYIIWKTLT